MVESVPIGIETVVPNQGIDPAQRAHEEQLAEVTAKLNNLIAQVSADPTLTSEQRKNLIDKLNSAVGSTSIMAIDNLIAEVKISAAKASAEASSEMAGNVSAIQQAYGLSHYEASVAARFSAETWKEIHIRSANIDIDNHETMSDLVHTYKNLTTEDAIAAFKARPEVAKEFNAIPQNERDRQTVKREVTDQTTAKLLKNATGVEQSDLHKIQAEGLSRDKSVQDVVIKIAAEGDSHNLQQKLHDVVQAAHDKRAALTRDNADHNVPSSANEMMLDKQAMIDAVKNERSLAFTSLGNFQSPNADYAKAETSIRNINALTKGTDESRIDAYVRIYNDNLKENGKAAVDQTALRKLAENVVKDSDNAQSEKNKPISIDELIRAEMEGGAQALIEGNLDAAKERANKVADLMAVSGESPERVAIARAYLIKNAEVAIQESQGTLLGIDKHEAFVTMMNDPEYRKKIEDLAIQDIHKSKSATELENAAHDYAVTQANKAQFGDTVGDFTGAIMNTSIGNSVADALTSSPDPATKEPKPDISVEPTKPAPADAEPVKAVTGVPEPVKPVETFSDKVSQLKDGAITTLSDGYNKIKGTLITSDENVAAKEAAAKEAAAKEAAAKEAAAKDAKTKEDAQPKIATDEQLAKEQAALTGDLKKVKIDGHIDEKTHEFISADGKKHLKLTGDAAKDLIAIQAALHGAHVSVASNDSNSPVPNAKPAPAKGAQVG